MCCFARLETELGNSIFTVAWDEIQTLEEIGHGTFGAVFKGIWRGDLVAVKKIKCKIEDTQIIQVCAAPTMRLCDCVTV